MLFRQNGAIKMRNSATPENSSPSPTRYVCSNHQMHNFTIICRRSCNDKKRKVFICFVCLDVLANTKWCNLALWARLSFIISWLTYKDDTNLYLFEVNLFCNPFLCRQYVVGRNLLNHALCCYCCNNNKGRTRKICGGKQYWMSLTLAQYESPRGNFLILYWSMCFIACTKLVTATYWY